MGSYKKRFVKSTEEDRVTNLPEHLIDLVLERLPFQDAIRTSILSKKWRYRWNSMKALVLDEKFFNKFAKNGAFGRNGVIRIINQVLILHKGPIWKFHLHIPNMFLDGFQEVDQWMLLLSRNNIKELVLSNSNRRYELSSHVFSCLELTKLELENCFFRLPLRFEGFLNLQVFSLNNIEFGANLCGTQINLPQLKKLSLRNCTNVNYNFNIKAISLQSLVVIACPDAMVLRLLHSPWITIAVIGLRKPLEDVRPERMNWTMILSKLPRVEQFYIDNHFVKCLTAEKIPKWLPHMVDSLKYLGFVNFQLADLNQLHVALCLLRNSPNLETFHMRQLQMEPRVDEGPASNHLEAPNCLDCTLNQLQTVEIRSLKGSRPEMLFIKLLLAHSPSLEKFTITPSGASVVQKRLDMAKEFMQFPRASPKAKMFYLDP